MNTINKFQQISINIYKYQLNIDKIFGFGKLIIVNPPCAYLVVGAGLFYNNEKKQSIYNN